MSRMPAPLHALEALFRRHGLIRDQASESVEMALSRLGRYRVFHRVSSAFTSRQFVLRRDFPSRLR